MKRLHILFISSWYPDRITLVNGDFIQRHAKAVSKIHTVTVLFVKYDPGMRPGKQVIETSGDNFNEVIIYFNFRKNIFEKLVKTFRYCNYYLWGYKYIRQKIADPDIIHANIIFPVGIIALLFKFLFSKPYLISEHWSVYLSTNYSKIPRWQLFIDRLVVKNSGLIAPVTENLKESLQNLKYKSNYQVVPNVVDVNRFYPALNKAKDKTFIHISTLYNEIKNISGILDAVKRLSEIRQDFTFGVLGTGELDNHVQYATRLGILNKYVFFHGVVDHAQVREYISSSICLVMFSNYESLPCVIVESLACGVPVISTDVGGIGEHITPDKGILIAKGNTDALVEAMNYMLDNFQSFDESKLREYAVSTFSEDTIATKFNTIYQSLLAHD